MALRLPIKSTAGAVRVKDDKGGYSLKKVKVSRYITGKRPEYAPVSSDESGDGENVNFFRHQPQHEDVEKETQSDSDSDVSGDERIRRERVRRRIDEPVVLAQGDEEVLAFPEEMEDEIRMNDHFASVTVPMEDDEDVDEFDEEEIARRRARLREKVKMHRENEEIEVQMDDRSDGEEEGTDESEYEEYTDSDGGEEEGSKLRPVFIQRNERVSLQEKEKLARKERRMEEEKLRKVEMRRRETLKLMERDRQMEMAGADVGDVDQQRPWELLDSEDESDAAAYEEWKGREMRRLKRDKEERESMALMKAEADRIHGLTEAQRLEEFRKTPKEVTNKAEKGKYKFLQRYYHRGAYFLDEEDDVLKRNFAQPTLEDHFNKTILPKVMQVKNFGRSGRTKYTHLVDQDTTSFESPWVSNTQQNHKFMSNKAGGLKPVFERPSQKTK